MEIYKNIKDFENYEVSNFGNIRNNKTNRIFKQNSLNSCGYKVITLMKNNKKYYKRAHRLVAEAFLDNVHNYEIVNHIDGDKTNNNVQNLEYCNNSQNQKHAIKLKLKKNLFKTRYSKEFKNKVIKLRKNNKSYKEISNKLNITHAAINYIINLK